MPTIVAARRCRLRLQLRRLDASARMLREKHLWHVSAAHHFHLHPL